MHNIYRRIKNVYPITKSDMYNHSALMSAYEYVWTTLEEYGDTMSIDEYATMSALYGDLGDYIAELPQPKYHWQSATMGNIVPAFGDVLRQAWDGLIHYHTIDIRWHYCREGY